MKSISNEKDLTIAGKKVTVKKLPIGKLVSVLQYVGNVPQELAGLDKKSTDEIVQSLPLVIASALPFFADAVVKAADNPVITKEFLLDECGLDDALDLVAAIMDVNNVAGIVEKLKKIKALNQPQAKVA